MSTVSIGRGPSNDFILHDKSVSRDHCKVDLIDDHQFTIEDNSSSQGIFINGRKVLKAVIQPTDSICLGQYSLSPAEKASLLEKTLHKNNIYKKEFKIVFEKFLAYEKEKNTINKDVNSLLKKSGISVGVIGILSIIPNIDVTVRIIGMSVITPIIFFLLDQSPDFKIKKLDKLKASYENELSCPKCTLPLLSNTTSYWSEKTNCPNKKCNAIWR